MINLTHLIDDISSKTILSIINQRYVWDKLLMTDTTKKFKNIFRNDNNPGCFIHDYKGKLLLADFADSTFNGMDIFEAVKYIYKCNYPKAVEIILELDGGINLSNYNVKNNTKKDKNKATISILPRDYLQRDKEYWSLREIRKEELIEDNVIPIEYFIINGKEFKAEYLSYCYMFPSNNVKIYQPYAKKEAKWFSNTNSKDVWKFNNNSNVAIITKGYKEGRILCNNTDFDIYAIQNESIKTCTLTDYDKIFTLFDNDKAGVKLGNYYKDAYDYEPIKLDSDYNDLDQYFISDSNKCKQFLKNI